MYCFRWCSIYVFGSISLEWDDVRRVSHGAVVRSWGTAIPVEHCHVLFSRWFSRSWSGDFFAEFSDELWPFRSRQNLTTFSPECGLRLLKNPPWAPGLFLEDSPRANSAGSRPLASAANAYSTPPKIALSWTRPPSNRLFSLGRDRILDPMQLSTADILPPRFQQPFWFLQLEHHPTHILLTQPQTRTNLRCSNQHLVLCICFNLIRIGRRHEASARNETYHQAKPSLSTTTSACNSRHHFSHDTRRQTPAWRFLPNGVLLPRRYGGMPGAEEIITSSPKSQWKHQQHPSKNHVRQHQNIIT